LIENEKSTISVRKKIRTDPNSVGKTLSFAPCDDNFFWNHPDVHIYVLMSRIRVIFREVTNFIWFQKCKCLFWPEV